MSAPHLIWFRNDLRLGDHAAVAGAARAGPVVALYVLDDEAPGDWRMGAAQRWWLHYSLAALARDLEARGGALLLRRGAAATVVPAVAAEIGAAAVHTLTHYEAWAKVQDAAIAKAVTLKRYHGALLAPPASVLAGSGGRYRIFTPWWRKLQEQMPPARPQPAPEMTFAKAPAGDTIQDWRLLPAKPDWATGFDVWTPGEAGAAARLADFLEVASDYDKGRNLPSQDGSSRLSPHLALGEISIRQVWHAVADAVPAAQAEPYLRELGWRDFASNILDQFPDHGDVPGRAVFDAIAFRDAPADLAAWQRGRTGYPIVDAGMRQLWTIGWMHNRVRMIAASFLVKHLLIDWRVGERWFWDCLVDADMGNNSLGWQWVMGSGVDSSPFNRVFAPVTQSAKFDAAAYIREWVPELANLRDADIHAPWEAEPMMLRAAGVTLGRTYPYPIVGHAEGRARALAAYGAVAG
ncbi:cryptochrome/photolyase family protein [Polymorphobacter fuscus]|uniref:Deoxyribodipyrimidine photo-lyase n=1 Tax=Sandarakinorhabdus fusca TaxID=1439888 RepID=A0A7C9KNA3_9SPHN|nr:deoxyribodipyrimidine photo-lyase [Polymorphobacter fuscus]KAB7646356.1 deoxyribodipyrimidine photo-lyase [Polymorphobacter fuscus]MQT17584.1 deoxyribodipyrimidine photo-lyase [Polymorphobacter fuscus]NJC09873.1 deoxyribodipyrimidine photo-lyase [Polymorphobacter fuscus]